MPSIAQHLDGRPSDGETAFPRRKNTPSRRTLKPESRKPAKCSAIRGNRRIHSSRLRALGGTASICGALPWSDIWSLGGRR